ncbi:hypothetical protein [Anaerosporobacter faecicola]|uniref:hypothetical protein n=1 Tax=Anaerosporobacter faecicola TaxID=2718714 RepID=UPI00143C2597|nr:hypothetical protein [Anaerosporobacter faecicola]
MKKISKIVIAVLTVLFAMALTGCSDRKAEQKYYDDVMAAVNNATTANSTLITDLQAYLGDVTNEDNKKAALEDLDTMEKEFTSLRDLSAPKRYKEAQKLFKEGAEEALNGIASYRTAIEGCTADVATDQEAYDAFYAGVSEGDEFMSTANSKITEAAKLADDAD